jgi:hypothetical protein
MNYCVNFKGDVRLTRIMMNAYRKQGCPLNHLWHDIQYILAQQVLERELSIVQAIVDTRRKSKSERNVAFEQGLLKTTFNGYPLMKWATELDMSTEMKLFLIETGFTPGSISKISEGPASIISLVIDYRKWAFEDVKYLIRKGHDVNKYDQNSSKLNSCRQSPFHVALRSYRYDIAKLLLLSGAQPIPRNTNYLNYQLQHYARKETLYLLITCNSFLSVAVEGKTLLMHLLNYNSKLGLYFHHYTNIILLMLDKIYIFCHEDRKALLDYQNDKSLPHEILEKIHTILYEPDSLTNICRKRLHRHYRCHFHRFIDILIDEAFPKSITEYLQCKDLLLKYFRFKDIADLDNSLAGISLNNCTFS